MEFERNAKKLTMLCWFSYMINYLARYGFSTSMSEMVADGIFDITFAGAVGTAFLAAYGTGQLVNGLIGDKVHPKFMIFI
ncbi:MAG TPA: MFS transporter, partial [Clostridia bacterium]|nr:MFS transporter [Clostridia bacterium]